MSSFSPLLQLRQLQLLSRRSAIVHDACGDWLRTTQALKQYGVRHLVTKTHDVELKEPLVDPGKFVDNATMERLLTDAEFAEFMKANFPAEYDPDYHENKIIRQFAGIDPRIMALIKEDEEEKAEMTRQKRKLREERSQYYPRNIRPLTSYIRNRDTESGTNRCNYIRKYERMVPGLINGGDPRLGINTSIGETKRAHEVTVKTPHNLIHSELARYRWNFQDSRVYNLRVYVDKEDEEGTLYQVVPKNVNWHPVQEEVYCVNFARYHPLRILHLPWKTVNEEDSPALKHEGFMIPLTRKIPVTVEDGVDIPDFLELDCTGLQMKEVIRRDRVLLPDGVQFARRVLRTKFLDFVICKVEGSARDMKEGEEPKTVAVSEEKKAAA